MKSKKPTPLKRKGKANSKNTGDTVKNTNNAEQDEDALRKLDDILTNTHTADQPSKKSSADEP